MLQLPQKKEDWPYIRGYITSVKHLIRFFKFNPKLDTNLKAVLHCTARGSFPWLFCLRNLRVTSPKHDTLQFCMEWTVGDSSVAVWIEVRSSSTMTCYRKQLCHIEKILQKKRNKKEWTKSWFVRSKSFFATIYYIFISFFMVAWGFGFWMWRQTLARVVLYRLSAEYSVVMCVAWPGTLVTWPC